MKDTTLITATVTFSMTTDDVRILDELSGPRGRSVWLRRVLRKAQAAKIRRDEAAKPARKGATVEARRA